MVFIALPSSQPVVQVRLHSAGADYSVAEEIWMDAEAFGV
jgi:hypothetical protein